MTAAIDPHTGVPTIVSWREVAKALVPTFRQAVRGVLAGALIGAAIMGHLGVGLDPDKIVSMDSIDVLAGVAVTFYFTTGGD